VEPVAEIIAALESRGMTFWADGIGLRFDCEDATLEPGDSRLVGELVYEREHEALEFIRRRESLDNFGKYAGMFRLALYRIRMPQGALVWLRDRAPKLYRELTVEWPDEVQRIWEEGGTMEAFGRATRGLEEARFRAANFYSACRKEAGASQREEVSHGG
jgi:hypothetical protein